MRLIWGIVVCGLALFAWGGQTISWFAPGTAVKLGLMEDPDDVEPTFLADMRGEALWDTLTLWTMVVAGVLLMADHDGWPYLGLVGGGMYVYFSGRGVLVRAALLQRGLRIGDPKTVRVGILMLALWGLVGLITIVAAVVALEG